MGRGLILERVHVVLRSVFVDQDHRGEMGGKELEELRRGALEAEGGFGGVVLAGIEHVEGFGEHCWVVVVVWGTRDLVVLAAGFPEVGAGVSEWDCVADGEGEGMTEAGDGDFFVLCGAASFACLCGSSGWGVGDGDVCGDFVAVLTSWALGSAFGDGAVLEELIDRDGCGVRGHVC